MRKGKLSTSPPARSNSFAHSTLFNGAAMNNVVTSSSSHHYYRSSYWSKSERVSGLSLPQAMRTGDQPSGLLQTVFAPASSSFFAPSHLFLSTVICREDAPKCYMYVPSGPEQQGLVETLLQDQFCTGWRRASARLTRRRHGPGT